MDDLLERLRLQVENATSPIHPAEVTTTAPRARQRQRMRLAVTAGCVLIVVLGVFALAVRDEDRGRLDATARPGGDNAIAVPPEAVDPDAVAGPGTRLGADFTVAEGSALIGLPIPEGSTAPGFSAYLFVDGDPDLVVDAYLAQAAEFGFEPLLAPNDGDGFEAGPIPADRNRVGRCGLELSQEASAAPRYVCAVTAEDAQGRCFHVAITRGEFWSHGFVRLVEAREPLEGCFASSIVGDLDEDAMEMPSDWPIRPQAGAELDRQFGGLGVPVQPGSDVVASPVPSVGYCADLAVLRVTGDASAVLESYVSAVRATLPLNDLPWDRETATMDGVTRERRSVIVPGGGSTYVLDLVTAQDGRAFLYANTCEG